METVDLPLQLMPIQLRYLHSFLPIYVFPLAGNPTITIRVGALTNLGFTAGYVQVSEVKRG